jgi:hypothetical protein
MNVLFLDDSSQESERFVGIGGVIFRDTCINTLNQLFYAIKQEYGVPTDAEIKWSPKQDNWIHKNLREDKRNLAYSAFLNLAKLCDGTVMVTVICKDITSFDTAKAKWQCIEFISERFQFFLQSQDDANGIIIEDFPGSGKEEKRLLKDYYEFRQKGTRFVKPSNIIMNLLTTESQWQPGLQIADLVVGITTAMCTSRRDYAINLWQIVKEKLYRNPAGSTIGCGLKIFPKESAENIYKRLFPEYFEQDYTEYIEEMRHSYSQVMSEDELDTNFPRF